MARPVRVGCVSFLNSKPLIDGLAEVAGPADAPDIHFDVPSALLAGLETGDVDIALCPVIDYFRSRTPLSIVPVGGIGCDGPTLTVRLYSTVPLDQVQEIHADTDSHTSIALLRVLMAKLFGRRITIIDFDARRHIAAGRTVSFPPAMLLIGDKVVADSPPAVRYPHQLDLGEGWKQATGLPFVFAVWMARTGVALGQAPQHLAACRERNAGRIAQIAAQYAAPHGWPLDLAQHYLGELLKFEIGPRQLEAIRRFGDEAAAAGVIGAARQIVQAG